MFGPHTFLLSEKYRQQAMTVNCCHTALSRFRAYPFLMSVLNVLLSRRRKKGDNQHHRHVGRQPDDGSADSYEGDGFWWYQPGSWDRNGSYSHACKLCLACGACLCAALQWSAIPDVLFMVTWHLLFIYLWCRCQQRRLYSTEYLDN